MATFNQELRKAYNNVEQREKERGRSLKDAGYKDYRDIIRNSDNSDDLYEAAEDCIQSSEAFSRLSNWSENMADTLSRQAESLTSQANRKARNE